jgi:hypothetical protein
MPVFETLTVCNDIDCNDEERVKYDCKYAAGKSELYRCVCHIGRFKCDCCKICKYVSTEYIYNVSRFWLQKSGFDTSEWIDKCCYCYAPVCYVYRKDNVMIIDVSMKKLHLKVKSNASALSESAENECFQYIQKLFSESLF